MTAGDKILYILQVTKWKQQNLADKLKVTHEDFHKAEQVNSNSQLYKQAGNAIVVDVLEAIFKQMFLK